MAAGPYSAQIQAAIRNLLAGNNTWTGTNTFSGSVLTPTLTGVQSITFSGTQSLVGTTADLTELRRSTNPQTFSVYNTFTSATNYERLSAYWTGNEAILEVQKGSGGGAARALTIGTVGAGAIRFQVNNANRWAIDSSPYELYPVADNAYDIGIASTNRVRTGYFGTSVVVGGNVGLTTTVLSLPDSASAALPSIRNSTANDGTGILFGSGRLGFGISGTEYARVNGSGIGLGTNSLFFASSISSAADTIVNRSSAGVLQVLGASSADTATLKANKLQITGLPAFVASDKYVVVDSSGNFHVSALGPAS